MIGLQLRTKFYHKSLPDLIVLPTEIYIGIYTNSPSIHMLPMNSQTETVREKNYRL
jgi:hypothetical protein